ncbi:transketolase [Nitriliruptoria bacterium AS10]|nr:transketolase [Salsipaludibacter albus]
MDGPFAASSGHQGTAMALAPLAHVLYSRVMKYDPSDPHWADRDRFVLSAGHASILQYSMLYLTGHGLELDDLRDFRQFESKTPGHPEAGHTAGVEVTTGPLGQGFGNAVGMAIAERWLRATFGSDAIDHHTWVIASDGDLMEGVSHEAAELAGHLRLGHLTVVFDDNHITIDGETSLARSSSITGRFEAYGWDVVDAGDVGDDLDRLEELLLASKETERPTLIRLRTHVGTPSPEWTDDHSAHGNPFSEEDISRTKEVLGIPDEPFFVPGALVEAYREHAGRRGEEAHDAWSERNEELADDPRWTACWDQAGMPEWTALLPEWELGEELATRKAIQAVLDAVAEDVPGLLTGSADLTGSTGTALPVGGIHGPDHPEGRQFHFGIREHGMGTALVGMAAHGGVLPLGATFFVFLDYMRPPVRLASLSRVKAIFLFTHDSVGVGEDGPTHQPVEHLATLRAVPDLQVLRPADANEVSQAFRVIVEHDGPSVLVLTRQGVKVTTDGSAVERGAGIVVDTEGQPDVVLLGTGSEVSVCVEAAEVLAGDGVDARVVSMPSWERFAAQDAEVQDEILPDDVPVLSVEAAATLGWARWADDSIGIDRFGASAPGAEVLDKLGINVDHVVSRARALLE